MFLGAASGSSSRTGRRADPTSRAGALRAARWVVHQKPGLYDMLDVLGLSVTRNAP